MKLHERVREAATLLGAAVPVWILGLVFLTVIVTSAESLGLSRAQTASWIMALIGIPAALSIATSFLWRQPLFWTGHLLAVVLFASSAEEAGFAEFVAASMVAGGVLVVLAVTGVTGRVTSVIPPSVVMGLIAGVVAPFVWRMFAVFGTAPAVVGSVLVAYVVSQRMLGTRVPPVFPALVVGVVAAGFAGQFGELPSGLSLPEPVFVPPEFSLDVILAISPVLVVLMIMGNAPSVIYLRSHRYDPPERLINVSGGGATVVSSLLGPMAITVAAPVVALLDGPEAVPREHRYRSVFAACVGPLLIAVGATLAAPLAAFVPFELIVSVAGLALLGVLVPAIGDMVGGPLKLGPVVAFVTALSDISLLGLGPFFWSLVLGTGFSAILEREGWARFREPVG